MTRIAVIPGDGIGGEVIAEAAKVLGVILPDARTTEYDLGAERYLRTGEVLPPSVQEELAAQDAILLGAVGGRPGDPSLPPGILERGLLLKLRFDFDQYVNLRPARLWPGTTSPLANPGPIDFVVVREGTEGLYAGAGGTLHKGSAAEVATEESLNTRYGVERVIRDAFHRATKRGNRLTLIHKSNVLVHAGDLWTRTFNEVAEDFPAVTTSYQHVDAAAMYLVTNPAQYDVIVTDNLFGDILTDIAAAVTGGIGLAASGCVNPDGTYPSMFEPVHGSAPDIAGQGIADPIAAIMSVALLLDHLGHPEESARVTEAVAAELATRVPGTQPKTSEVGDRVAERVA
ncbi:3-isopropylmalate dehydrogenase [Longispora albida]|uniref:3-isopropylmalate dehydrogenase n=1 Tax=Longispora albida TaxID=203523 RepID=UPI00035DD3D1|nr:3-isopropylmalate dehydrogenase [Longispora albida]